MAGVIACLDEEPLRILAHRLLLPEESVTFCGGVALALVQVTGEVLLFLLRHYNCVEPEGEWYR